MCQGHSPATAKSNFGFSRWKYGMWPAQTLQIHLDGTNRREEERMQAHTKLGLGEAMAVKVPAAQPPKGWRGGRGLAVWPALTPPLKRACMV